MASSLMQLPFYLKRMAKRIRRAWRKGRRKSSLMLSGAIIRRGSNTTPKVEPKVVQEEHVPELVLDSEHRTNNHSHSNGSSSNHPPSSLANGKASKKVNLMKMDAVPEHHSNSGNVSVSGNSFQVVFING
jgi:hypothetical protein